MSFFTLDKTHERTSAIVVRFAWMTPELAKSILGERNKNNRSMKANFIRRLARGIQAGHWQVTHQGIAFSPEGVLLDGQNRLAAVVASGQPVLMMVAYNVPPVAQGFMDAGSKRTLAERIRFGEGLNVDSDDTAIAAAMIGRGRKVDVLDSDISAFIQENREAIRFARSAYPKRWGGSQSALYAVLARAYFHVDRVKLVRFCVVMNLQPYDSHEQAAAKWAKEMTNYKAGRKLMPQECFERTQRALVAFLEGETKNVIKPESRNLFPLPGEDESEAYKPAPKKLVESSPIPLASRNGHGRLATA